MSSDGNRPAVAGSAPVIRVRGAREHNLRDVDVAFPRERITVITGPSGSGKSSLAFDTIFAEAQRRYLEGLAPRLRARLGRRTRPDVDGIDGLPPTLAVSQLGTTPGPRSTVGTLSEIHDLLRLLWARAGTVHCPQCDRAVERTEPVVIVERGLDRDEGVRFLVLAPLPGEGRVDRARRDGFVRVRVDGTVQPIEEVTAEPSPDTPVEAVVDRLVARPTARSRLHDSVETALRTGDGRVLFAAPDGSWEESYSPDYRCAACDLVLEEPRPATFSFNGPAGACPECTGLGEVPRFERDVLLPDPAASIGEAASALARRLGPRDGRELKRTFRAFAAGEDVPPATPLSDLDPKALRAFLDDELRPWLRARRSAARSRDARRAIERLAVPAPCPACGGARLKPASLAVRVGGLDLAQLSALSLADARDTLLAVPFEGAREAIVRPILDEATTRFDRLLELGLEYLTLDRRGTTLSGGERQRVRLATRLGSELVGVLYVLDEPTIGLHPADTGALLRTLRALRDAGNTLLVVEHDPGVVRAADHLIEIGPGAGRAGGRVLASGPTAEVLAGDGPTARVLRGETPAPPATELAAPVGPRAGGTTGALHLEGASAHNLRDVDVRVPLGALVAVTGVSGAGKSTLARDVLLAGVRRALGDERARPGPFRRLTGVEGLDRALEVAPNRRARSERSVPATQAGVFGAIRDLFARSEDARIRGYGPERFSFNRRGGRCEACKGLGERAVPMDFLPDVRVRCDLCWGRRYHRETLDVRFRGLDVAEVLALSVAEARETFAGFARIAEPLAALERIGLGYLPLGQSARTLSGGEAQRIRLAAELARRSTERTLYLLDEPTTGLHATDVVRLVAGLRAIAERGDTVVVIEHDLGLIAAADHVIDLGPGAGPRGGELVCSGFPSDVANHPNSLTGNYLRPFLALLG